MVKILKKNNRNNHTKIKNLTLKFKKKRNSQNFLVYGKYQISIFCSNLEHNFYILELLIKWKFYSQFVLKTKPVQQNFPKLTQHKHMASLVPGRNLVRPCHLAGFLV